MKINNDNNDNNEEIIDCGIYAVTIKKNTIKINGKEVDSGKKYFVAEVEIATLNGKPMIFMRGSTIYFKNNSDYEEQKTYESITLEGCRSKPIAAYRFLGTFGSKEAEIRDGFVFFREGRIRRKLIREENGIYVLEEKSQIKDRQTGKWVYAWCDECDDHYYK